MDFIERSGYDGGATRLEDSLAFAAEHGFPYLDFSADIDHNAEVHYLGHTVEECSCLFFPAVFRRLETEGYDGYYTMAFGSLDDKLAARELFRGYSL